MSPKEAYSKQDLIQRSSGSIPFMTGDAYAAETAPLPGGCSEPSNNSLFNTYTSLNVLEMSQRSNILRHMNFPKYISSGPPEKGEI